MFRTTFPAVSITTTCLIDATPLASVMSPAVTSSRRVPIHP